MMEPEEESRYTYSLRTRTENRAMAIVDHLKRTGKTSIKSTEARIVLEGVEGQELDRNIVKRALDRASEILRAPKSFVGGVARIVLPDPQVLVGRVPPGDTMSRLRRSRVPWGT